jgi:hypothetical protein
MSEKPIKVIKSSGVEVAIWKNEQGLSFSFRKNYKTKDGEWKTTNSLSLWDLPVIASLATVSFARGLDFEEKAKEKVKFTAQVVSPPVVVSQVAAKPIDDDDIPY